MEKRFDEVVTLLNHYELMRLKRDLENGGLETQLLIEKRIREEERKHEVCCTTCGSTIEPEDVNNFTMIFGPDSLKKKASFCAIDCIEYFLKNIKEVKAFQKQKAKPMQ